MLTKIPFHFSAFYKIAWTEKQCLLNGITEVCSTTLYKPYFVGLSLQSQLLFHRQVQPFDYYIQSRFWNHKLVEDSGHGWEKLFVFISTSIDVIFAFYYVKSVADGDEPKTSWIPVFNKQVRWDKISLKVVRSALYRSLNVKLTVDGINSTNGTSKTAAPNWGYNSFSVFTIRMATKLCEILIL